MLALIILWTSMSLHPKMITTERLLAVLALERQEVNEKTVRV